MEREGAQGDNGGDPAQDAGAAGGQQQGQMPLRDPEGGGASTATVKIVLVPEGFVMTAAFAIGLTVLELKKHFAIELKVPAGVLQIFLDGCEVEELQSLMELGVQPHGSTQLEISSTEPLLHPLRPTRPPLQDNMADVITVQVDKEGGEDEQVVVEIERPLQRKAFLGGYRHRLTGALYHHASVQTLPKRRPERGVQVFSRNTQTAAVKEQAQQCAVSTSTQMTSIGCYISCMHDKLITPQEYVPADVYHSRRLTAVITLQSFVRRWLACRLVQGVRRQRDERLTWVEEEERRRKDEKEEKIKEELQRRMNPQSKEDFNLLYTALERWRCDELQRIDSTLRGAERKAALCALLQQEMQHLASIDAHRTANWEHNQQKATARFLEKSAAPKQWRGWDGRLTQMDTEPRVRARELQQLYGAVTQSCSREERRCVLLRLKSTVQEYDCPLTWDIVELIDRELDLLSRKLRMSTMEGLRMRIATLFRQLIRKPTFNPEVAKLLKVPQDPSQMGKVYFCRGCQRGLQLSDFCPAANARTLGRCRHCTELYNQGRQRRDFTPYRSILRSLQAEEESLNKEARISYLLQEADLQYLVDVVWGRHSALSGCSDLYDLVMVRWERLEEWSPWNCILLTQQEAAAHLLVHQLDKVYAEVFVRGVLQRHIRARRYFSQLPAMAQLLDARPVAPGDQPVTVETGTPSTDKAAMSSEQP